MPHTSRSIDPLKVLADNSTDESFPDRTPTDAEPTGDGILNLLLDGGYAPDHVRFVPYALGDDDSTFTVRVIGWSEVGDLWVPQPLAEVVCTLGTAVGVAEKQIINTEHFCDTLVLTYPDENVHASVVSPGNNLVGHFLVDTKGFARIEVTFSNDATTSANALYSPL